MIDLLDRYLDLLEKCPKKSFDLSNHTIDFNGISLDDPSPMTNFSSLDYIVNDPLGFGPKYKSELDAYNEQIRMIELFVSRLTKSDTTHLLIVYGAPGIGKTHVVQSVMKDLDIPNVYIRAKETSTNLYKNAYEHGKHGEFIILDDCDSIFDDPVQMNLLKAMGESSEKRIVTYDSSSWQTKDLPTSFEYEGKVIILTNRVVTDNPDYDALLSRAKTTTMEVSNFGKLCKSIDILLSDKRYNVRKDYTARANFVSELLWINQDRFANEKYSLREARKLYGDLEMLGDDVNLFTKELNKRF